MHFPSAPVCHRDEEAKCRVDRDSKVKNVRQIPSSKSTIEKVIENPARQKPYVPPAAHRHRQAFYPKRGAGELSFFQQVFFRNVVNNLRRKASILMVNGCRNMPFSYARLIWLTSFWPPRYRTFADYLEWSPGAASSIRVWRYCRLALRSKWCDGNAMIDKSFW